MLLRVKEYIRQRSQMEGVNRRLAEKRILTFHVGYIYIYGKIHLFLLLLFFLPLKQIICWECGLWRNIRSKKEDQCSSTTLKETYLYILKFTYFTIKSIYNIYDILVTIMEISSCLNHCSWGEKMINCIHYLL